MQRPQDKLRKGMLLMNSFKSVNHMLMMHDTSNQGKNQTGQDPQASQYWPHFGKRQKNTNVQTCVDHVYKL